MLEFRLGMREEERSSCSDFSTTMPRHKHANEPIQFSARNSTKKASREDASRVVNYLLKLQVINIIRKDFTRK